MPTLSFTKLIDKVLDHTKTRTIRQPRKVPKNWKNKKDVLKVGDTLHCYIKIKVGTAKLISIEPKQFQELTEEDAILDGFNNLHELHVAFKEMHPKIKPDDILHILTFAPGWSKQRIVKLGEVQEMADLIVDHKLERIDNSIQVYFE